jgi:ribosomal protein S12 methylthiotransferase
MDLKGKLLLPELIERLDHLQKVKWIRLLYTHPASITEPLIEAISRSHNVCHYLDLPLQHVSDKILKLMRRGITQTKIGNSF